MGVAVCSFWLIESSCCSLFNADSFCSSAFALIFFDLKVYEKADLPSARKKYKIAKTMHEIAKMSCVSLKPRAA